MNIGTKSLLFGVHQFLWHPVTVWLAWTRLYGRPDWRTCICIAIHDLGYWGSPDMDGAKGKGHPMIGALIARKLFGPKYYWLCLLHSRSMALKLGEKPSRLCWADKFSMIYDPSAFYLLRARLSGEIKEYRRNAADSDFMPELATDEVWHRKLVAHLNKMAEEKSRDLNST